MANLNNSAAYGFSANVATPLIIDVIKASEPKMKVEKKKSAGQGIKPIMIKIGKRDASVVLTYPGHDTIALSIFNMMYASDVVFMHDGKVYVVDADSLRANWEAIMDKAKQYTDGANLRTTMTYANLEKVEKLAKCVYNVDETLPSYEKYQREMAKLLENK